MAKARIEITGDSHSFEQAARRVNADLKQMKGHADSTGEAVSKLGGKAKAAFAGIVSTAAITSFVKKLANVRGEFQQYEMSLATMLKSEEKALTLMGDLVDLAARTPFDLPGVVEGAKKLSAFGIEAEDMIDTLTMLGDVAAGMSLPIGDLVYMYGLAQSKGRVFSMDMRRFMMRGVPVVEELAKQFGVTKAKVDELVASGKIGGEEIKKAFQSMTSEGGKFHNLMLRQSATITGKMALLRDNLYTMFNELGERSEGVIYGTLEGISWLVQHYESIGKAIIELIAVYGSYKAVLITISAVQKAHNLIMQQAAIEMSLAKAQGIALSVTQAKLAATTKLLTGSVKGLNKALLANPYALIAAAAVAAGYAIYKLSTRKSELEKASKEANKRLVEEKSKFDALTTVVNDTNIAYDERAKALDKLKQMVPNYHASLTKEGEMINNNRTALDEYVASLEKTIRLETLNVALQEAIASKQGLEAGDKNFWAKIVTVTGGEKAARRIVDASVDYYENLINQLMTEIAEVSKGKGFQEFVGPLLPEGFDRDLGRIKTAADYIRNAQQNIATLNKELETIKASPEHYADAQEWAEAMDDVSKRIKEAQENLALLMYGDKDWKKKQEEYTKWLKDSAKDANEELVSLQLQQEKERIDAMEEGVAKRRALFEMEQRENLLSMQQYLRDVVDEQMTLERNKGKIAGYGEFDIGVDGFLAYKIAEKGLKPTEQQMSVINEMVKWWNQRIVDMWVDELIAADSGQRQAEILLEQIDSELMKQLSTGKGFDALKDQASIIFADISELSTSLIQDIISNAEKYVARTKDLTNEEIAEYRRAIDKANEYLVQKNPFAALSKARERYIKASKDYAEAIESKDIEKQNSAILEMAASTSTAGKALDELNSIFNETLKVFDIVAEAMGVDKGVASALNSLLSATSKLAVEMTKAIGVMGKLGSTAADAVSKIGSGAAMGGMVGAIIGLVAALAQLVMAMDEADRVASQEKVTKYVDGLNAKLDSLKRNLEMLRDVKGIGDSWFTKDLYQSIINANKVYKEAFTDFMKMMSDAENRWGGIGDKTPKGSYARIVGEQADELLSLLERINVTMTGADIGGYFREGLRPLEYSIDNLKVYINLLKDLEAKYEALDYTMLAADTKALWTELEAYVKAYEDLQEAVQSVTGDISSSTLSIVNAMWKEIRSGGEATFDDLSAAAKRNVAEVIEEMVSQQLWATIMADYFDDLGEGLVDAIVSGGDILGVFDTFWEGMEKGLADYTAAYDAFLQTAQERGWDMFGVADKSPEDSIKGMREELSKLQEQWAALTAAEREGDIGKQLFGDIKDLEAKIAAAESLYDITRDIEGSINDLNNKISELTAQWNALSPEDRDSAFGQSIKADIEYYQQLLEQANAIGQSEFEAMQALIASSEIKYSLYQKWIELYGEAEAEEMMGAMLADAEKYLSDLRSGIATLQAKVLEGVISDEEIQQLEAWEQQLADILNAAVQAEKEAAQLAFDTWNELLDERLADAKTDYQRLRILQEEYLNALALNAGGFLGEMNEQYIEDLLKQQDRLNKEIEENIRERYKTEEQLRAEMLLEYEEDIAYARDVLLDADLVGVIEEARDEWLSDLAQSALEATEEWSVLFGDLQDLSVDAYMEAMALIRQTVEESTELTEEAKEAIVKSLDEIDKKWEKTLAEEHLDGIKKSFDELLTIIDSTNSLLSALGASSELTQMVTGLRSVISGYKDLKLAIEAVKVAQDALNMTNVFTAVLTVIQGIVSVVSSLGVKLVQLVDTSAINELADTYDRLTDAINRSVGARRLQMQQEAALNLQQQKADLERQLAREQAKWGFSLNLGALGKYQILGPDQGVVKELESQIKDLDAAMQDLGDTMKYEYLQTDAVSFASQLSDILTTQYDFYEDMMKDVEALTSRTLSNITKQWLTARFLEDSIEQALEALYGGDGEPTAEAYAEFRKQVEEASQKFLEESERMKGLLDFGDAGDSSDYNKISRISADDFGKWLGEWRAQRIALIDNGNTLKSMLEYLKSMANSPLSGTEILDLTRKIESNTAVLPVMLPQILAEIKSNAKKEYGY